MDRSRQRTGLALTAFSLFIPLVLALLVSLLGNGVPERLPSSVRTSALPFFFVTIALMLAFGLTLLGIRRIRDEGGMGVSKRQLERMESAVTILLGLLGALGGILTAWVTPNLPAAAQSAGPWLFAVLTGYLVVAPQVGTWLEARAHLTPATRDNLLQRVADRCAEYLEGPLQLPQRATLGVVDLSLPSSATAVPSDLRPGDSLLRYYDSAQGQLLILGDPGSGKSTQLHMLGRELARKAQGHESHSVPVVLDLSTWADNRDPFARWLREAIVKTYQVTKRTAEHLVNTQQYVALLDAPDVMGPNDRERCVRAVNEYGKTHPTHACVICFREAEYASMATKLDLNSTIALQPLTNDAIFTVLLGSGPQVARLASIAAADATLLEALRSPLVLNVVVLTMASAASDAGAGEGEDVGVGATSIAGWRERLFERYITHMLAHRPGEEVVTTAYPPRKVQQALSWLAYMMRQRGEATFYPEQLTLEWLPTPQAHRVFTRSMWGAALVGGCVIGGLAGVADGSVALVRFGVTVGLITATAATIGVGAVVALVIGRMDFSRWIDSAVRRGLVQGLITGLEYSVVCALCCLVLGLGAGEVAFGLGTQGLVIGMEYGLEVGLILGALSGFCVGVVRQFVETLDDSVPFVKSVRMATPLRALIVVMGLVSVGLVAGLGDGLVLTQVALSKLTIGGLGNNLVIIRVGGGVAAQVFVGVGIGLVGGLVFGGSDLLRLVLMQRSLRSVGLIPTDLKRFLQDATTWTLLREVGAGYQIVPQLLSEHLANGYAAGEK